MAAGRFGKILVEPPEQRLERLKFARIVPGTGGDPRPGVIDILEEEIELHHGHRRNLGRLRLDLVEQSGSGGDLPLAAFLLARPEEFLPARERVRVQEPLGSNARRQHGDRDEAEDENDVGDVHFCMAI